MNEGIQRLKCLIAEAFTENPVSTKLDFKSVVEDLPLRYEEDIIQLLPYVMNTTMTLAESNNTAQIQVLETIIRMFNGYSDCSTMKASAIKIRECVSHSQKECIGLWFQFLRNLGTMEYVDDDLEGCTNFWMNSTTRSSGTIK